MKSRWGLLTSSAIFLYLLFFTLNTLAAPTTPLQVSFINVSQGDSALIQDSNGFDVLIDGGRTSAGPVGSCSFHNDGGGKFFLLQIGPETAIEVDAGDPDVTVIADLGDEAIFFSGMLRVRVGETVLQVATWHPSSKQDEALVMTQEIARIALERLP